MVMKDAGKKAHYFQIDHKVVNLIGVRGAELLVSGEAWEKYAWTKKYFSSKPVEGYFIWIKKQIDFPLMSCLLLASPDTKQNLQNLVVIEKGLKICLVGSCASLKKTLCGAHKAQGKIILKEGASLNYRHSHSWGKGDVLKINYSFLLEKKSNLSYLFNVLSSAGKFNVENEITALKGASCDFKLKGVFDSAQGSIKDNLILKGKGSSGQIQLRMAVEEKSKVLAHSEIRADAPSKGHLDCQGLLIKKGSSIVLKPSLVCNNREAQITHEASVGRISEDQLSYLRMRGFNEAEAIKLIVNGFLNT